MPMRCFIVLWLAAFQVSALAGQVPCESTAGPITTARFREVLETVATAWNTNQPTVAAGCFALTAVYLEPPDRQRFEGRDAIESFFRASTAPALPDRMTWHHLAFDETGQVGLGEYTYRGQRNYHGVAVVRVTDGLIASWREYQYPSAEGWEEFIGPRP